MGFMKRDAMDIDAQANRILRLLWRREIHGDLEQITAIAIAEALQVDPLTVRMAVELLEIRRCVSVSDASNGVYTVTLTDLGRDAVRPSARPGPVS
jgi:hypothetical protein